MPQKNYDHGVELIPLPGMERTRENNIALSEATEQLATVLGVVNEIPLTVRFSLMEKGYLVVKKPDAGPKHASSGERRVIVGSDSYADNSF